jgi:hypothetical protein
MVQIRLFRSLVLTLLTFGAICRPGLAQNPFDLLIRPELAKLSASESFAPVDELSIKQLTESDGRLPGTPGTLLIAKTNQGRWARILISQARQKIDAEKSVPILLMDRFATCMDGEDRALVQSGKDVRLFAGFRFSLDLGQVVPPEMPADFEIASDGKHLKIKKDKGASLWIVKKEIALVKPVKPSAIDATKPFGPHWFTGHYRLFDDGRRMGRLEIESDKDGNLSGALFSDKDNKRYELFGKVAMPNHTAQFTVRFPRSEQFFQAWLFTGDGSALAGTTRFGERETGFYAIRVSD